MRLPLFALIGLTGFSGLFVSATDLLFGLLLLSIALILWIFAVAFLG